MITMKEVIDPVGEARDDYAIFSGLARRLGTAQAYTENRSARDSPALLYETTRKALLAARHEAPDFDTFRARG